MCFISFSFLCYNWEIQIFIKINNVFLFNWYAIIWILLSACFYADSQENKRWIDSCKSFASVPGSMLFLGKVMFILCSKKSREVPTMKDWWKSLLFKWDGSADKRACTQAWRPEFSPRIHNGKWELTSKTCPLTTHAIACAFTHTSHTHMHTVTQIVHL